MFIGEWPYLLSVDGDGAKEYVVLKHRHDKKRTSAGKFNHGDGSRYTVSICLFRLEIQYLHHLFRAFHATKARARARTNYRIASPHLSERGRDVVHCDIAKNATIIPMHDAKVCAAHLHRIRQHSVEHRPQIAGRTTDDLEHVSGGGLLLQRFAQLVEQSRVLNGDDGLGSEVFDQFDLLIREWPNLKAK